MIFGSVCFQRLSMHFFGKIQPSCVIFLFNENCPTIILHYYRKHTTLITWFWIKSLNQNVLRCGQQRGT